MSGAGAGGVDRAALLARIRAALRSQSGAGGDDSDVSDLPATAFSEVPQSAYDALSARWDGLAGNGQPIDDLFDSLPEDAANRAAVVMLNGLSQGPLAIAQNLAQVLQMSQQRAETIARNELVGSYRDAQMANYRANSDVVGQWIWSAAVASACIMCVDMDGTIHSMDEDLLSHVLCFPAGVIVSGPRAIASTTRWYVGEIVEIETSRGYFLPVTPNHPILTSQGWVAAGELVEGGDVISRLRSERPFAPVNPDDYQVPAPIEQVARAVGELLGSVAHVMPTAPEDFHGDGEGSQVQIVRTNGLLRSRVNAALLQPLTEQQLRRRHMRLVPFTRLRNLGAQLNRVFLAARGVVDALHAPPYFFRRERSQHQSVRLSLATNGDTRETQPRSNGATRYAVRIGQRVLGLARLIASHDLLVGNAGVAAIGSTRAFGRQRIARRLVAQQSTVAQLVAQPVVANVAPSRSSLNAFAGDVGRDRILKVTRRRFSGHVYNLQTSEQWYISNNIIAHNCRCEPLPVTKSWDDILSPYGISAAGIPETSITQSYGTGRDWFLNQSEATQIGIMGPAKYEAWMRGDLSLDDLVGVRNGGAWGNSLYERSLKDLGLDAQDYLPQRPLTGLGRQGRRAIEEADLRQAAMRARGGEGLGPQGIAAIKGAERTAAEMDMVKVDMGNGMFTYVLRDDASQFESAANMAGRDTGWQNIDDVLAGLRGEATEATGAIETGEAAATEAGTEREALERLTADQIRPTASEHFGKETRNTYRETIGGEDYFVKQVRSVDIPELANYDPAAATVAADEAAKTLGLDDLIVPTRVLTNEDGTFAVSPWITGGKELDQLDPAALSKALASVPEDEVQKIAQFEYLVGDGDRNEGGYFLMQDGTLRAIDFEGAFDPAATGWANNLLDIIHPDDYTSMPLDKTVMQQMLDAAPAVRQQAIDAGVGSGAMDAFDARVAKLEQGIQLDDPRVYDLLDDENKRYFPAPERATETEATATAEPTVTFATDAVQTRLMDRLDNPTDGEFARLMGAQPGDRVEVDKHGQVFVRNDDSYAMRYVLSPDAETGNVGMYLQEYSATDGTWLPVDDRFAAMLRTQVEQAQASNGSPLSYLTMKTRARVGDYESLLSLGFDAPIDMHVLTEAQAAGLPPLLPAEFAEKFPGVHTLGELVSTPEGAAWWHENGMNPDLRFDLTPGSDSILQLNDYLRAHGMEPIE